jgi:hypothetical protein
MAALAICRTLFGGEMLPGSLNANKSGPVLTSAALPRIRHVMGSRRIWLAWSLILVEIM